MGGILWERALKIKGGQESWQVFQLDNLFQAQERPVQIRRKTTETCQDTDLVKQEDHDWTPVQGGHKKETEAETATKEANRNDAFFALVITDLYD